MSSVENQPMRTGPSSVTGSNRESEARTARSRGSTTQHSLQVESSRHSYPKTPGNVPLAYGQTRDGQFYGGGPDGQFYGGGPQQNAQHGFNMYPSQPLTHALPGGSGGTSPFSAHDPAAGFPIQPYRTGAINPLPFNASGPAPPGLMPYGPSTYTVSGPLYHDPDYTRRGYTTGSILPGPPPGGFNPTPPSTSYSTALYTGQQPQQQTQDPSKSNADYADDCFNIFWLFFLLGPLTWPCGLFGICSDKQSERMAGFVSGICLVLVIIAVVIVITQTPDDSNSDATA